MHMSAAAASAREGRLNSLPSGAVGTDLLAALERLLQTEEPGGG
jgi:hypothetical protein